MEAPERDCDPSTGAVDELTEESPALRDAGLAARRMEADEAAAGELRDLLMTAPLARFEPDPTVRRHLEPGEIVHGLRRSAILKSPGDERAIGYGGSLYLTSRRLVHLGRVNVTVQLNDIVEASIAAERLLLSLRGGEGLAIDVDRPRTFRTEIAAALRASRR